MIRKIVHIDEEKCNGCGLCAQACHEGAVEMIDGKAKLTREDYCDGLGDCLPGCPVGAITIEEREAPAYDDAAVRKAQENREEPPAAAKAGEAVAAPKAGEAISRLAQWPCQIKLVPIQAPFFDGARLLIAADCTAYAYAGLHEEFMKGRTTLIGCPKLDAVDYSEKLTEIIAGNDIREITLVRMEVPCCGGLEMAAKKALAGSGKAISLQVVTISRDGRILG